MMSSVRALTAATTAAMWFFSSSAGAEDDNGGDAAAAAAAAASGEAVKAPAPAPVSAGADVDIWWVMLSRNHECSSDDIDIGEAETVEECAMRCAVFEGCQYFIFGHGDKKNKCWYEATSDGCQHDGTLVENDYSLYQIKDADVNHEEFRTLDSEYYFYRMVVTASRSTEPNASFCVEDIVFYDGNNTPIDTAATECTLKEVMDGLSAGKPARSCCMSTPAVTDHSCVQAFDASNDQGWFCSSGSAGFIGYQFADPTYIHSYAVHDVYGVHALDPEAWTLQASVNGADWVVLDTALNTPWISEDGVYYNLLGGVSYSMVFRNAECSSPDIMLGVVATVEKCAEACANINGCEWFIFGKGDKAGNCYYEITDDGCQSDGYPQRDNFDLYYIQRSGGLGDGGSSVGQVVKSEDSQLSNCGSFFGSCSNVFLLLFLLLTLTGGIWLVRSILRKRYARVSQGAGLEYEADHDNIEA